MRGARRTPSQARSHEMVERVLAAAARVLEERGYAGLSTNRVAAAAGVSVGSLYRYFHDKDDLVEELRRRSADDVMADLSQGMADAVTMPTRDAIRHVLAVLVAALQRHRAVTRDLLHEVPLGAHGNVLPEVERQLAHFTRMFVASHAPDLDRVEAEARIHLAMGIALTTCLRIALDPPAGVSEDRLVDLTAELLTLGLTVG